MLGNFASFFLTSADSFQNQHFQKCHQNVKQYESRSGPTFFKPDLRPNCFQRNYQQMTKVAASVERVK